MLGVRYIVAGDFRKTGDRFRISARLIDSATAEILWAERIERPLALMPEASGIAFGIGAAIKDRIFPDAGKRPKRTGVFRLDSDRAGLDIVDFHEIPAIRGHGPRPVRLKDVAETYDWVLRARAELRAIGRDHVRYARAGTAAARKALQQALTIRPRAAHAELAWADVIDWSYLGDEARLASALETVGTDGDPRSRLMAGLSYLYLRRFDMAIRRIEQSIDYNPNDAEAIRAKGLYRDLVGRHGDAIPCLEMAMRLNPSDRDAYVHDLGIVHYTMKSYREAAVAFESISRPPFWIHAHLAACYAMLGELPRAQSEAARFMSLPPPWASHSDVRDPEFPRVPKALIARLKGYKNAADFQNWIDGFRRAGLPV